MVTCGFYNAIVTIDPITGEEIPDLAYDAIQMSSIFDGIIRDGVFMHYGNHFAVTASEGMTITVDVGRCWFNHSWTLNDALLPIDLEPSELIMNRIDAIVVDVDSRLAVRNNNIIVIKGTPATNPVRPTLISTNDHWQYPLAYIEVKQQVSSIRQANITSMIGTTDCPYVTAPLEIITIDDIVAQWADEWNAFYDKHTADILSAKNQWNTELTSYYNQVTSQMNATMASWNQEISDYYEMITSEMDSNMDEWITKWNVFYTDYVALMGSTKEEWEAKCDTWFLNYINNYTAEMDNFRDETEAKFDDLYNSVQGTLSGDAGTALAADIVELKKRVELLEAFEGSIETSLTVHPKLIDSNNEAILDSSGGNILADIVLVAKGFNDDEYVRKEMAN